MGKPAGLRPHRLWALAAAPLLIAGFAAPALAQGGPDLLDIHCDGPPKQRP